MAITTIQGALDEYRKCPQIYPFQKPTVVSGAVSWASSWFAAGGRYVGVATTTGKANGTQCDRNTVGALPINNPRSGRRLHVIGAANMTLNTGALTMLDRYCHVTLAQNEASGAITGMTASSRMDAAGSRNNHDGGEILVEVTTAFGAGDNVVNFTYTNSEGVGGRVTKDYTLKGSAALGRVASTDFNQFVDLQDGDWGVRSIESMTLVSGTGTGGTYTVSIVRPIMDQSCYASLCVDVDYLQGTMLIPEIVSNSCLFWMFATSGTNTNLQGILRVVDV